MAGFMAEISRRREPDAAEAPGSPTINKVPPNLAALQRHVLNNPDILQQMLESPAMQSLLNEHDFLRSVVRLNPQFNQLLQQKPELLEMLQDNEVMKQATEALRNPVHVRDVLRSTDRSMAQLEAMESGTVNLLRQMCVDINRPLEDPQYRKAMQLAKSAANSSAQQQPDRGSTSPRGAPEAVPQDDQAAADGEVRQPPDWLGTFDTNAMAAMMQDQNMQQLFSQLVQNLPGRKHPDDPFIDANFIGQLFEPQTIQAMAALQEAVEKLSMSADYDKEREKPKETAKGKKQAEATVEKPLAPDSSAMLSGLHPKSPAANFKESFMLFLQAEQESPEVRYKGQLRAMHNMGFTDKEACIQALHAHGGNMAKAVDSLIAEQQGK